MKESFRIFFNKDLSYQVGERVITNDLPDGEVEEIALKDIIASTVRNYESFKKWFWEGLYKPYEVVTVLFPAAFNNRLLGPITRRFQSRLSNYGYDSENGELQREELKKRLKEREKKDQERASQN